jgi:hypothetical protein
MATFILHAGYKVNSLLFKQNSGLVRAKERIATGLFSEGKTLPERVKREN